MLFSPQREDTRGVFFSVWDKYHKKQSLTLQEQRILQVILDHPEYHSMLSKPEKMATTEYFSELGETNPFLHMGLHLTIIDQVSLDQPKGIRKLYTQAIEVFFNQHEAEHCIANSLAIEIYETNKNQTSFNEKAYIKRIKNALKKGAW